ncbi:MAG: DUF4292 domain-containing protein [Bacteroidaceae bacterium]|nr:DUF4292 domain-containing protein [Bacteroidaceae bacterium]
MKRLTFVLSCAVLLLAGCKSSHHLISNKNSMFLSSKVQLTIPNKDGFVTVNGFMKMKREDRIQFSFLMPFFRSEIARIEVTSDQLLLVDRMNKCYVRVSKDELNRVLSTKANFPLLEKILMKASLPGGKTELTGKELGIASLDNAKLRLYDFSLQRFSIIPTEFSSKYTQVSLEDLIKMLTAL